MTNLSAPPPAYRFSVAPMLDWTDRWARYFLRQISDHALLYTEMVTTGAILHGDRERHLDFFEAEHPVALQLGGSDPSELAECAYLGQEWGYDEINLNVGCPSDRVQSGRFGACLMAEPQLVADCVAAMKARCNIPVTVKCRIGIDDQDDYQHLHHFIQTVHGGGCQHFIIHARKAWLSGLSPKENREIPPLQYETVYKIKREFPNLEIVINGGIKTLAECQTHLEQVDGVMLGREAYQNPYLLANVDALFFNDDHPIPSRIEIIEKMIPFLESQMRHGVKIKWATRHMLGLFQGIPGAKSWRRHLSVNGPKQGAGIEVLKEALELVSRNRV